MPKPKRWEHRSSRTAQKPFMSRADQDSKITKTAKELALGVLQESATLSELSTAQLLSVAERMALMQ